MLARPIPAAGHVFPAGADADDHLVAASSDVSRAGTPFSGHYNYLEIDDPSYTPASSESASPPPSPLSILKAPSNSPLIPETTRLPTIPFFAGLPNDLPDISDLSFLGVPCSDSGGRGGSITSGFAFEGDEEDEENDNDNDTDFSACYDNSFTTDTTESADTTGDFSFGPYTPSRPGFLPHYPLSQDHYHHLVGLEHGLGLGILGLRKDFGFNDDGDYKKTDSTAELRKDDSMFSGVSVAPSPLLLQGDQDEDMRFAEVDLDEQGFSGHILASIPECDSWSEIGDQDSLLCHAEHHHRPRRRSQTPPSELSLPLTDGEEEEGQDPVDSGTSSFQSTSSAQNYGPSNALPLFVAYRHRRTQKRNDSQDRKTFWSSTISSDLKRTLSLPKSSGSSSMRGPFLISPALANEGLDSGGGDATDTLVLSAPTVASLNRSRSASYPNSYSYSHSYHSSSSHSDVAYGEGGGLSSNSGLKFRSEPGRVSSGMRCYGEGSSDEQRGHKRWRL